jgi:hypothetical protein
MTDLAAVAGLPEESEVSQLGFFDAKVYQSDLFSLTSANNHSVDEGTELKPGQYVEFRGSGTVIECVLKGFASDSQTPMRVYKVSVNHADLLI